MNVRTPWRAVASLFVLNGALFGAWASRVPAAAERHGLEPASLGLVLLALAAGAIVSFPLAGSLADRFGAARVSLWLAVFYALTLPLIGLAPSPVALAVALFAFGAAHGSMDVVMNAWGAEVERRGSRPIMASLHAMWSVGAGLGALIGSVATDLSLVLHFSLFALLVTPPAVWIAAIPWDADPRATGPAPAFALPSGPLLLAGVAAFCASLGEGAMADWSAIYLVDVLSQSEASAALGYAVFSLFMVAGRFGGDHVIARIGRPRAARGSGVIATLGVLTVVTASGQIMALAGFALIGLGYALIMPLAFSRAAAEPGGRPGLAIAGVATLGYGGMLLGPPIIGFLAHLIGLSGAFWALAALAALIVALGGALAHDH